MNKGIRKNLIPGIEKFIDQTLEQLGLTPEISVHDFVEKHKGNKHRYGTPARSASGRSVIFYARLHNNEDAKNKFLSDIVFLKKLFAQQSTREYIPQSFKSSTKNKREWFTREFLTTPALGTIYETTHRLTAHDAKRFAIFFNKLQKIPRTTHPHLEKRDGNFSTPIMEGNFKRVKHLFTPQEKKVIPTFIHTAYTVFNNKTTHPVHGDCHPGNILYDSNSLFLIDWETTHLNLRVSDIAYFYAGLTHTPSFRKKLLTIFEKQIRWKKEFRELFPLATAFYALAHLYTLSFKGGKNISKEDIKKVRSYCVQIVKKSITGYTELRKL